MTRARHSPRAMSPGGVILAYIVFQIIGGLALLSGEVWTLAAALVVAVLLIAALLGVGRPNARRWRATLRLLPPRPEVWRWVLVAVPVFVAVVAAATHLYTALVPVPPEAQQQFPGLGDTPRARLAFATLAVAVAPVVEEIMFRGLVQRPLVRRYGMWRGIAAAALIFALVHFQPWLIPPLFFLGVCFGAVAAATRSVWPAALLHAVNNALAVAGREPGETPPVDPTVWQPAFGASDWRDLVLAAATLAAGLVVSRMLLARLRAASTSPVPVRVAA